MNLFVIYKDIIPSFAGYKMLCGGCDILSFILNLDTKKRVVNFRPTYFFQNKTRLLYLKRSRSGRLGESEIEPPFLVVYNLA